MSQAQLNFDESALDPQSMLYDLYSRLHGGMVLANQVSPPDYAANPPYLPQPDEYGDPVIDVAEVERQIAEFTGIQTKNAAFLLANSILSAFGISGSGSTGGGAFVSRSGDTMDGNLAALKGFQAGSDSVKVFEVYLDSQTPKNGWAEVTGYLKASLGIESLGAVKASSDGYWINGSKALYEDGTSIVLEGANIQFLGDAEFDSSITLGDFHLDSTGAFWDGNEYYHAGNSNIATADWEMKDAIVNGDLEVKGSTTLQGPLQSNGGFMFSVGGGDLLYSDSYLVINPDTGDSIAINYVECNGELWLTADHWLRLDGKKVLGIRDYDTNPIVSLSAPGMILNLGDSGDGVATKHITLQSDLCTYDSVDPDTSLATKIITKEGKGYFPNGLSAKSASGDPLVFSTYSGLLPDDQGVVFPQHLRLGAASGPSLTSDNAQDVTLSLPYQGDSLVWEQLVVGCVPTASWIIDDSLKTTSLQMSTTSDLLSFSQPVEAEAFAVKSGAYETALFENQLFFGKGAFIEGLATGMGWNGDADFADDLFSYDKSGKRRSFISGFAGAGWAIMKNAWNDFHATFDSLTIRKKMRVYELEVQKISATNGSLWVSDSCSGDEVIAIADD